MEMKKQSAAEKLVERIVWLKNIFRMVSLCLICAGVLLPAVGPLFFGNSFGNAWLGLIAFGFLFALSFGYCRFVLKEYNWNLKSEDGV